MESYTDMAQAAIDSMCDAPTARGHCSHGAVLDECSVEVEPCGCTVELDGRCHHGNESPVRYHGMI